MSPAYMAVHGSSVDSTWRTPAHLFAALDAEFRFTLDPCAAAPIREGIEWFDEADQGLWREWSGRVFVNPPYGRAIGDWMRKVSLERDRCEVIVGLLPARTDTEWWHEHVMPANEVRFLRGRVRFEGPAGPLRDAPFPSVVVVWRSLGRSTRVSTPMRKPGTWTAKDAERLREQQERLAQATSENMCGDLDCEGFRHEAALFVLRGGTTHRAYADVVQWAAQSRPVLPPGTPLTPELLAAFRETFAEMAMDDPAREAGLMLIEALANRPDSPIEQAQR